MKSVGYDRNAFGIRPAMGKTPGQMLTALMPGFARLMEENAHCVIPLTDVLSEIIAMHRNDRYSDFFVIEHDGLSSDLVAEIVAVCTHAEMDCI